MSLRRKTFFSEPGRDVKKYFPHARDSAKMRKDSWFGASKVDAMLLRPVNTAVVFLLGLILASQCVFTISAGAAPNTPGAKTSCCCTGCDSKHCATPACCAKPADNRAPSVPVSPRSNTQKEVQALATGVASVLTLQAPPTVELSPTAFSFLRAAAVPIFQRDCSYLI